MRTLITISVAILSFAANALGHPQVEHLKEAYKAQGDSFFIPLYWLPGTRQTVVKYIPDHQNWVGFEMGYWKKIDEADKLTLINELGAELDRMDGDALNRTWQRIRDWERISSQLSLLSGFLDQDEAFLDMAFGDPTLRPAFKWLTDMRKPDFDTKHIGSSFTSGEMASFYPHLIQHLIDTPERERLMCFFHAFSPKSLPQNKPRQNKTAVATPIRSLPPLKCKALEATCETHATNIPEVWHSRNRSRGRWRRLHHVDRAAAVVA